MTITRVGQSHHSGRYARRRRDARFSQRSDERLCRIRRNDDKRSGTDFYERGVKQGGGVDSVASVFNFS